MTNPGDQGVEPRLDWGVILPETRHAMSRNYKDSDFPG